MKNISISRLWNFAKKETENFTKFTYSFPTITYSFNINNGIPLNVVDSKDNEDKISYSYLNYNGYIFVIEKNKIENKLKLLKDRKVLYEKDIFSTSL